MVCRQLEDLGEDLENATTLSIFESKLSLAWTQRVREERDRMQQEFDTKHQLFNAIRNMRIEDGTIHINDRANESSAFIWNVSNFKEALRRAIEKREDVYHIAATSIEMAPTTRTRMTRTSTITGRSSKPSSPPKPDPYRYATRTSPARTQQSTYQPRTGFRSTANPNYNLNYNNPSSYVQKGNYNSAPQGDGAKGMQNYSKPFLSQRSPATGANSQALGRGPATNFARPEANKQVKFTDQQKSILKTPYPSRQQRTYQSSEYPQYQQESPNEENNNPKGNYSLQGDTNSNNRSNFDDNRNYNINAEEELDQPSDNVIVEEGYTDDEGEEDEYTDEAESTENSVDNDQNFQ
jgi:hypothetical protein